MSRRFCQNISLASVGCFVIYRNIQFSLVASVQAGLDQVKWIDGDDCLANGILGDVEDAEGIFNFDLLYFDATGFTAQMIAFPEEEVGGPYAMCCECDLCTSSVGSNVVIW